MIEPAASDARAVDDDNHPDNFVARHDPSRRSAPLRFCGLPALTGPWSSLGLGSYGSARRTSACLGAAGHR